MKIIVDQMLPSSYISSLLVSILRFCIWFPICINVRLYFGAKMVTFCIIHIGNRKRFLKHHPPPARMTSLSLVNMYSAQRHYLFFSSSPFAIPESRHLICVQKEESVQNFRTFTVPSLEYCLTLSKATTKVPHAFKTVNYCLIYHTFLALTL